MTTPIKAVSDAEEHAANEAAYRELLADLHVARRAAWLGGPQATRDKHIQRGRLLVRERIAILLDAGSPFLEIGE
ncbi:MAG: methylcrotonoyl-CoA carboxylase, partial [Comamonadaceae bacterium]|nr:methylcrotonoyl-CoA carboxylase [Comamonadaceae bacterium]